MKINKGISWAVVACLLGSATAEILESNDGRSINAEVLAVTEEIVRIKHNGKVIPVKMSRFSAATQKMLLEKKDKLGEKVDLRTASRKPKPVIGLDYVKGSTTKLEQLIGDWDKHLQVKTANQTQSRFGIIGTDLGASFEHKGRLIFLFGDTMGAGGGDCLAFSESVDPEKGLRLHFFEDEEDGYLKVRPPGVSMGGFEVPAEGISLDDDIYLFCTTDHSPDETMGRCVLVSFDEKKKRFRKIRDVSARPGNFINVAARLAPPGTLGLPKTQGEQVLLWGSGAYRKSHAYLATIPADDIKKKGATRYFTGLTETGEPVWSKKESDATPVVKHPVIGEISVSWVREAKIWLMTYNSGSPRGINLRWSSTPWGPWSDGIVIFHPWKDDGYAKFMHALRQTNDDGLAGPVITRKTKPEETWGGEYGPYMIERFTRIDGDMMTIYYLMSTWNPYTVVLMKSQLNIRW